MAEPTSSGIFAITAAGISVFGVATGIHPMLFACGVIGGWWQLSYLPSMRVLSRVSVSMISGFVAAWATPVIVAGLTSLPAWPPAVTGALLQYLIAAIVGLLAWTVIGKRLTQIADRKAQEMTK
jgi:hypothetical protein